MPLLSTLNPSLRSLIATVGTACGIQAGFAVYAVPAQTEKWYDFSGSLTFITCSFVSLYYPHLQEYFRNGTRLPLPLPISLGGVFHSRQLLMSSLAIFWAARLGTFLFQRIQKSGSDSRFDKIKTKPLAFSGAWTLQTLWITLTAFPVYLSNALPSKAHAPLGARDWLGLTIWGGAFAFEVIADSQKSKWRQEKQEKKHDEKFISSGLWSISRHPNYFGEVSLWAGQFILSTAAMASPSARTSLSPMWLGVAAASPIIEYLLITKLSGIPILERTGDKKFGDDPKWQEYKRNVPVFWPKPF